MPWFISDRSRRRLEMKDFDPYNETVRRCFENPVHAGDLESAYDDAVAADCSESENGARVVLSAGIDDGRIVEMRFRVWGCPHLIAAAETVCDEFEGLSIDSLAEVAVNKLMAQLSVPVTKAGRMILIEDAAALLLKGTTTG